MKNLLKNERGIINPLLDTMIALICIIIVFIAGIPILYKIGEVTIILGAPAPIVFLFRHMALVSFIIFVIAVFVILLAKVYRKTHDTQRLY